MAGRHLKELFRAFRNSDELAFRRAAQAIIEEEEARHHVALARDLRRIVANGAVLDAEVLALPTVPKDPDHGWELARVREPERRLDELVLKSAALDQIREVAKEVSNRARLDAHGVPRRNRLLFYGPPGCGKTSAAEALAFELQCPFVVVRLDSLVSSYLGQTAANLRRVFEFAEQQRSVVLFDEFDALGRQRDDPAEHGEIKRVVNSFLQLLDAYSGRSILIAATNHEEILDRALWRRFDLVLGFDPPTVHQIRALLRHLLQHVRGEPIAIEKAATRLKGLPHAAVEAAVWSAVRSALLDGRKRVTQDDLDEAIVAAKQRPW